MNKIEYKTTLTLKCTRHIVHYYIDLSLTTKLENLRLKNRNGGIIIIFNLCIPQRKLNLAIF